MDPQSTTPTSTTPSDPATQAAPAPASQPAPAPAAKTFTQDELNSIVQQRLAEDRARRERQPQAAPAAPANGDGSKPKGEPLTEEAVLGLMARERAFTTSIAGYQIQPTQLARMEAAFRAEKPADAAAWTQSYIADMGFSKVAMPTQQPSNPAPAATPASPDPAKPPAAAPAPPQTHTLPTAMGFPDIWNMTPEQFVQFRNSGQLRPTLERMWEAGARQQGAPRRPTLPQK